MTIVVFLTIIIINLFLAYSKNNSRVILWLSVFCMALLMCGYRRPFYGDLDNYQYMYDGIMDATIGLNFIFSLAKGVGISFWNIHYILLIIMLLVAVFLIRKCSLNWHFPIACFASYYIIISSDQIKNHTAFIFLIFAMYALYTEHKKMAMLLIVGAASIHYSFIVYLLLLLSCDDRKKHITRTVIYICFILTFLEIIGIGDVLLYIISKMGGIIEKYLGIYALSKLQSYTENRTRFGYLLLFGFQIIDYYLLILSYKWLPEDNRGGWTKKFNSFVINVNLIGFMFFPLFVYNQQWYRLIRELLLVNYCAYGNCYYLLPRNSGKRAYVLLSVIISVLIWFIGDLVVKTEMSGVLIPFFTNNEFLN